MKTGFTSVSLRNYPVEQVVCAAIESKCQAIEWGSDVHVQTPEDAVKARALCEKNGIYIRSYGTYYRIGSSKTDEFDHLCRNARLLGAKYLRTWLGTKGSRDTSEDEYLALVSEGKALSDIAGRYGLIVSNECHPNTFNDTAESSLRFLKDVGRENVGTYFQSWYRDKPSDMKKLSLTYPYVTDVHISFSELTKFQRGFKNDPEFIDDIVGYLKSNGFEGCIFIEFTEGDKIENLVDDVIRLRRLAES